MTSPLVIAVDIDGVLCEGPYLAPHERTAERYAAMRPYTAAIARFRAERPAGAIVYYVTARRRHLWRSTLAWLHTHVEANAQLIAGIDPTNKPAVAEALGCDWLFDDDLTSVQYRNCLRGVLVDNPSRGVVPLCGGVHGRVNNIGEAWAYIADAYAERAA